MLTGLTIILASLLAASPIPQTTARGVVVASSGASFTDLFNRANASPMSTTSTSGGTWTSGPGSMMDCDIVDNQLTGTGFWSGCVVTSPSFAANQSAEMTLTNSSQSFFGLYVRMQSGSAAGYNAFFDDATHIIIYKMTDSGSSVDFTTALGATFTVTVASGTRVKLTATGTTTTTLELFIDDVSQGSRTDSSSPYTSGQPGWLGPSSRFICKFVALDL